MTYCCAGSNPWPVTITFCSPGRGLGAEADIERPAGVGDAVGVRVGAGRTVAAGTGATGAAVGVAGAAVAVGAGVGLGACDAVTGGGAGVGPTVGPPARTPRFAAPPPGRSPDAITAP